MKIVPCPWVGSAFVAAMLLSTQVMAASIDFSVIVPDGLGGTLKEDRTANVDATLGKVAAKALFTPGLEEKLDNETKFKRGLLGTKVAKGGVIELTAEEVTMIKDAIAKAFPPNVVAGTWPLLDPAIAAPEPKL